ncbi:hypothetical protein [Botrimarina sp.]|uniref:hypothetical protein n=1 Tax=Botrimarina sp. TaxID=2795802 RepID=UPI0032EAE454
MDCDSVFWFLTVGPFPSGAAIDYRVERHLEKCASCRRFAHALQPTDEAGHEALSADERRCLPGYRGKVGAQPDTRVVRLARHRNPPLAVGKIAGTGYSDAAWAHRRDSRRASTSRAGGQRPAAALAPRHIDAWGLLLVAGAVLAAIAVAAITAIGVTLP